jgi:hypothetical protein
MERLITASRASANRFDESAAAKRATWTLFPSGSLPWERELDEDEQAQAMATRHPRVNISDAPDPRGGLVPFIFHDGEEEIDGHEIELGFGLNPESIALQIEADRILADADRTESDRQKELLAAIEETCGFNRNGRNHRRSERSRRLGPMVTAFDESRINGVPLYNQLLPEGTVLVRRNGVQREVALCNQPFVVQGPVDKPCKAKASNGKANGRTAQAKPAASKPNGKATTAPKTTDSFIGEIVKGKVTSVKRWGIFVESTYGAEGERRFGLVHENTELGKTRRDGTSVYASKAAVRRRLANYKEGQNVHVRVVGKDADKKGFALCLLHPAHERKLAGKGNGKRSGNSNNRHSDRKVRRDGGGFAPRAS